MFGLLLLASAVQAQPYPPIILTPFPPVISPPSRIPPPPRHKGSRAAPLRAIATLFSRDDYPQPAVDSAQQGEVVADVDVAPDGRASACTIAISSGFPALDRATCQVIRNRARFRHARNAEGEAVIGRWRQRVRWELWALPFASFERITRVASGPQGRLMSCAGSSDCSDDDFALDQAWMVLAGPPIPRSSDIVFERRLEAGDHSVNALPEGLADARDVRFAGRARIKVDYAGKVVGCVALSGGIGQPDRLCSLASNWLFKLGRARGETRTGVVSLILRSRTRVEADHAQP